MQVTFMHKDACTLCDEAWETLERVAKDIDFDVVRVNILEDEEAYERWWQDIPVILINGEEHAHWFLKEAEFRDALLATREKEQASNETS